MLSHIANTPTSSYFVFNCNWLSLFLVNSSQIYINNCLHYSNNEFYNIITLVMTEILSFQLWHPLLRSYQNFLLSTLSPLGNPKIIFIISIIFIFYVVIENRSCISITEQKTKKVQSRTFDTPTTNTLTHQDTRGTLLSRQNINCLQIANW